VRENTNKSDADTSRHDASQRDASPSQNQQEGTPTSSDTSRHVAAEPDTSRYVAQLEMRITEKDEVIGMLRGELANRNEELVRRNERERETNVLIRGLQNLVLRLQSGTRPTADVLDGDPAMHDREVTDAPTS
jgi:hypothetical protein